MHCVTIIEHDAHMSNLSACLLYFVPVARGRAILEHILFGMGTVAPLRPTVSDVSSDPYQILYVYQHTHNLIVSLSLPVARLLHQQQYHMHGARIRVAVDAAHVMLRAGIAAMTTALNMCVFPYI